MKLHDLSEPRRILWALMHVVVSLALVFGSIPGAMAAPGKRGRKGKKAAAAATATDGKTVAVMRFSGAPRAAELRADIDQQLSDGGYTTKGVALDLAGAVGKLKCKGEPGGDDCLAAVGKWLNSNPKTAADFIVFGSVSEGVPAQGEIVVYDIAQGKRVQSFDAVMTAQDLILPIVLPRALVTALDHHIKPPPGPTEAEQETLAHLDEPEQTPEEKAALAKAIEDAEAQAAQAQQDQVISTEDIPVDLKKDFKDFCRKGPRKKRKSREDPKDLRPKCQRGTFWGYWQPRAWVTLGILVGAVAATATVYGLALHAHGPYKDAVNKVKAFEKTVPGDPRRDPNSTCNAMGQCYDALATEVSKTGNTMHRFAQAGDGLLGASAGVAIILGIMIWQDRHDAKNFIKQEKSLRAISDLRIAPMFSRTARGAGLSFKF